MRKKLKTIGSEIVLILDAPVCDALKLQPDADVEVELHGELLIVQRAGGTQVNPVVEAFRSVVNHPQELDGMPMGDSPDSPNSMRSVEVADLYY